MQPQLESSHETQYPYQVEEEKRCGDQGCDGDLRDCDLPALTQYVQDTDPIGLITVVKDL
jgi:hypothetical protein